MPPLNVSPEKGSEINLHQTISGFAVTFSIEPALEIPTRIVQTAVKLAAIHVTSYIRYLRGRSFTVCHARRTETLRDPK